VENAARSTKIIIISGFITLKADYIKSDSVFANQNSRVPDGGKSESGNHWVIVQKMLP